MNNIVIINTTRLIDSSVFYELLASKSGVGICVNIFNIENMIVRERQDMLSTPLCSEIILSIYEEVVSIYSPIFFIGNIKADEIDYLKLRISFKHYGLYLSELPLENNLKKRLTYELLNSNDLYVRYKNKNLIKHVVNINTDINSNAIIKNNPQLFDRCFDLSKDSFIKVCNEILLN